MQKLVRILVLSIWAISYPAMAEIDVTQADNLKKVTLQLKWTHQFQFAGYYMAQHKGFYKQAGLDVNIKPADHSTNPINEVLMGRAEFGVGTSELLIHHANGRSVVVLGVIFQHSPLALLALEESGFDYITDLVDKRLMIESNSSEIYALLMQSNIHKGRFKTLPHSLRTRDLINRKVDAMTVYTTSEVYELEKKQIPYRLFSPRMAGIDFYGDNFFTTGELISDQPDLVEAFRQATIRGWKYAMNHPNEAIDYIINYYHLEDRKALEFEARQMQSLMRTDLIEPGYMSPKRWQHIVSVYQELRLIDKDINLDGFIYKQQNMVDHLQTKVDDLILLGLFLLLIALVIILYIQRYYSMKGQLGTITEKAPLSILLLNDKAEIVRWNHEAEQTFGWKQSEVLGRNIYDFLVFHAHHSKVKKGLLSVASDQKTVHIENKNLHKNGHEITCNWSNAPYEINGRHYIICMALDTSELRDFKAATLSTQPHERASANHDDMFLQTLVRIMQLSMQIWEESTSKSKNAFADESGLWRISIDGGTAKTRTLDKYLSLETIPQKPRWKNVINSANFILRTYPNHPKAKELTALKSSIQ